jgi:hypothetical protein
MIGRVSIVAPYPPVHPPRSGQLAPPRDVSKCSESQRAFSSPNFGNTHESCQAARDASCSVVTPLTKCLIGAAEASAGTCHVG